MLPGRSETFDFNPAAANKALELLGKHLGMFTERHLHGNDPESPVIFKIQLFDGIRNR